MFERYTERARRVLFFARYEASQHGSISIETEHLLLGLIRERKGLTSRIFARSHLSLENIRKDIEGRMVFRERTSTSVEIPFTAECKRALGHAAEEADRLLHKDIGTGHLLLGLLREERSVAASVLMDNGMRLQTFRDDIVQLLDAHAGDIDVDADETVERETVSSPSALGAQMLPHYLPSRVVHITYSFSPPQQDPWLQHAGNAWRAYGYTLAQIIAMAWGSHEGFVRLEDVPVEEATRYDFTIVLPTGDSVDVVPQLLRTSIEEQFAVQVARDASDPVTLIVRPR